MQPRQQPCADIVMQVARHAAAFLAHAAHIGLAALLGALGERHQIGGELEMIGREQPTPGKGIGQAQRRCPGHGGQLHR
ncbi:hypothetical protein D9M68_902020 [compost metagenome]